MIENRLDHIKNRKNFYRNNLRWAVVMLLFAIMIILCAASFISYQYLTRPAPYYYATSSDGQITQLMAVPRGSGLLDPENS